ncbi:MAG TPA: AbrB/MazE/SpoVT family DNA-binding domain-containing protein [Trueperaceae bacterium]|nr:AbrB/MazE/SpoVT family DNA-binding domain-containing protein [Trueperaceae bacterium]
MCWDVLIVTSRLTSKGQTTIPRSVRQGLQLREGDVLEFELMDGYVILRKAQPSHSEDPFVAFEEWAGDADQRAYGDL